MKYRLKKEAVPYFQDKYADRIADFQTWKEIGVDEKALEKVEDCHIVFGHEKNLGGNTKTSSLCGWDEKGARFHFTICFPSMKMMEYDKFHKGKIIREMMNRIQQDINYMYQEFDFKAGE